MKYLRIAFFLTLTLSLNTFDVNGQAVNRGNYWILNCVEVSERDRAELLTIMERMSPNNYSIAETSREGNQNYGRLSMDRIRLAEQEHRGGSSSRAGTFMTVGICPWFWAHSIYEWDSVADPDDVDKINAILSRYE